ncbi:probable CCR4-associated factor 1 homolog 6 [Olea europaea var. sylvestris]|uniref:probable CCR4-associated factor 1 homolog 6 n=1 Tax=Olea europaea var. sylvestris TaxID=158386 RepID=UPI000C1D13F3|nr:probable CCR4-associated factor 1 homolog 6 [Olea europaea var. sylvestris]
MGFQRVHGGFERKTYFDGSTKELLNAFNYKLHGLATKFNFMDFGVDKDLQNLKSIALIKRQGIDFSINKLMGISSADYAFLFMASRLSIATRWLGRNRTWITFHSTYDFGFLVKILSQQNLLDHLAQFMQLFINYKYGSDDQNTISLVVQFGTRIQSDLSNSSLLSTGSYEY